MRKKYLKTIKDVEALRNTDAKIYTEIGVGGSYIQFVNGWPCRFYEDGNILFGGGFFFSDKPYIEVEDEPSEDFIGKLGLFWDDDADDSIIDILWRDTREGYRYEGETCACYKHFRPLTPEEVEEYTGYKVVKEALK